MWLWARGPVACVPLGGCTPRSIPEFVGCRIPVGPPHINARSCDDCKAIPGPVCLGNDPPQQWCRKGHGPRGAKGRGPVGPSCPWGGQGPKGRALWAKGPLGLLGQRVPGSLDQRALGPLGQRPPARGNPWQFVATGGNPWQRVATCGNRQPMAHPCNPWVLGHACHRSGAGDRKGHLAKRMGPGTHQGPIGPKDPEALWPKGPRGPWPKGHGGPLDQRAFCPRGKATPGLVYLVYLWTKGPTLCSGQSNIRPCLPWKRPTPAVVQERLWAQRRLRAEGLRVQSFNRVPRIDSTEAKGAPKGPRGPLAQGARGAQRAKGPKGPGAFGPKGNTPWEIPMGHPPWGIPHG